VLLRPTRTFITRKQNRSTIANDPTAFVADKINMYQLEPARRALAAPTLAAVVRVDKNAVDDALTFADRTDHPALLLARKAHAVQLDVSAFEFLGKKDSRLPPGRAVLRCENRIAGQQKTGFFVAKVDVVYSGFRADSLRRPGLTAVFGVTQETAVTSDPATFAVEKVDGIEIVSAAVQLERRPALGSYGAGDNQRQNSGDRKAR